MKMDDKQYALEIIEADKARWTSYWHSFQKYPERPRGPQDLATMFGQWRCEEKTPEELVERMIVPATHHRGCIAPTDPYFPKAWSIYKYTPYLMGWLDVDERELAALVAIIKAKREKAKQAKRGDRLVEKLMNEAERCCEHCERELSPLAHARQRFCATACRVASHRAGKAKV
jgi:hypothetical protein